MDSFASFDKQKLIIEVSFLLIEVSTFYEKNNMNVPKMDDKFVDKGRSRRNSQNVMNLHHYQVEFFYPVIDMQLQELNNRFTSQIQSYFFALLA